MRMTIQKRRIISKDKKKKAALPCLTARALVPLVDLPKWLKLENMSRKSYSETATLFYGDLNELDQDWRGRQQHRCRFRKDRGISDTPVGMGSKIIKSPVSPPCETSVDPVTVRNEAWQSGLDLVCRPRNSLCLSLAENITSFDVQKRRDADTGPPRQ